MGIDKLLEEELACEIIEAISEAKRTFVECIEARSTYLPRPRMPLAPLARQSRRSFSMASVVAYRALWALLIISASCLVVALCGLLKNIPGRRNHDDSRL